MASPRLAASLFLRISRPSITKPTQHFRALPRAAVAAPRVTSSTRQLLQCRFRSDDAPNGDWSNKTYEFEDVNALSEKPDPNRLLIDTREPSEIEETGIIPGSLNIPVKSQPDAFFITDEEFEDRYGFERPGKGRELIFYCKSGVRSRAAAELARQAGWGKIAEYPGSWLDWEKNGGVRDGGK